jgi:double-stranded uracil-DNA glycosylase
MDGTACSRRSMSDLAMWRDHDFDVLAPGLEVIFCGLNPPPDVAAGRHSFANASNRFWKVLHLAGFTDRRLRPEEEHRLLDYRCGITAIVDRPTRRAAQVSFAEFNAARTGFEAKIRSYAPRVVAFLGKRGIAAMTERSAIAWGFQSEPFADRPAWVLPNPTGLNRRFALDALACAYAELRKALVQPVSADGSLAERR